MTNSKILCAVDLSRDSRFVINAARREAEQSNAALEIVHVQTPHALMAMPSMMGLPAGGSPKRRSAEQIARLEELRCSLPGRPEVTTLIPSEGSTGETLIDYAEAAGVDRIVIGHHPRSGILRWLFGSVSERVVRDSRIPVLVVPVEYDAYQELETLVDGTDRVEDSSDHSFPASDPPSYLPGIA